MKYKEGDKVLIIGTETWGRAAKKDIGKIGIITNRFSDTDVMVYVLNSNNESYPFLKTGKRYTWYIYDGKGIEPLKGQLMFEFMYK